MEKCPDCKKYFERTWNGSEYCPCCGQTKQQAETKAWNQAMKPRTAKPARETKEQKANRIWAKIEADKNFGFAFRLAEKMYLEHGYEFEDRKTVAFRNRQNSYEKGGKIVFGYESLRASARDGFREYSTIQQVWNGQGELTGPRGVWAEVLHEFAHVVQEADGRLYSKTGHRNKYHNEQFVEILSELQVLYPFEECE